MRQRREILACGALRGQIELRDDDALPLRQPREHAAPMIDDDAVTVGLAPVGVPSPLRGRDHEA